MRMLALVVLLALLGALVGCSGIRQTGDTFVTHGESFHLFGLMIPGDELELAKGEVPAGATQVTVVAAPADWSSVTGVINRILPWFHTALISGNARSTSRRW
jgi:hypothetical protein